MNYHHSLQSAQSFRGLGKGAAGAQGGAHV